MRKKEKKEKDGCNFCFSFSFFDIIDRTLSHHSLSSSPTLTAVLVIVVVILVLMVVKI